MREVDYKKKWEVRLKKREEEKGRSAEKLFRLSLIAAQLLAKQFKARKVYLFGSVASPEFFHEKSDVDLAVEGISAEKYFSALAKLSGVFGGRKVDLVPLEDAAPGIKKRIEEKGKLIYG
jgi:hypothetical protein